jgi:hypothetical protein
MEGSAMDALYLALFALLWALLAGMAAGCDRLGGAKQ